MKSKRTKDKQRSFALAREVSRVGVAWLKNGVVGLPVKIGYSAISEPFVDGPLNSERFFEIVGDSLLHLFSDLGPVYGKAGQVMLSQLSGKSLKVAETLHLDRLYGDWPALPFDQVEDILDHEIPKWRSAFKVSPVAIGVASMAQVHQVTDKDGRTWVIKIIKPDACKRMAETVSAVEKMISYLQPLAVTSTSHAMIRDLKDLCNGFKKEVSLNLERQTIEKVRTKLAAKRQKLLKVPEVNRQFSTDKVLTVEFFEGHSLKNIVSGKVILPLNTRKKLARSLLHELLVQVFEMGLFHGDPHAGNLILLEDGSLGLFDWGLAGELKERDRHHIANVLKAVITMDMERLVEALYELGQDSGAGASKKDVEKEVKKIAIKLKHAKEKAKKVSLTEMIEMCLKGAGKLQIELPEGLLLMSKSLITIEGLAKGIDPQVPLKRIASPVLLKAAKPGFQDFVQITKKLPKLAKQFFN